MMHVGYKFDISSEGLLLSDVNTELEPHSQVNIDNKPLNVGDEFILELNEDNCMFFRKVGPKQLDLEFNNGNKE